jgi:arginyl-tRNA synthetase
LAEFPEEVRFAGLQYAPHRLTTYALDVARAFHSFYTECRVLSDDPHLTKARLLLIRAARIVLHNTLALMGVSAPERMEPRETG